jgi:hypothetical protein
VIGILFNIDVIGPGGTVIGVRIDRGCVPLGTNVSIMLDLLRCAAGELFL